MKVKTAKIEKNIKLFFLPKKSAIIPETREAIIAPTKTHIPIIYISPPNFSKFKNRAFAWENGMIPICEVFEQTNN